MKDLGIAMKNHLMQFYLRFLFLFFQLFGLLLCD